MSASSYERYASALPPHEGFIRQYIRYASACSDAPPIYHCGVALTLLAAAVSKKITCPWMAGRKLTPNLYTMLVGPSRSARKTGSMDAGIDILAHADPTLVMPVPGSYEEFVAQIRRKPEGLLTYREFAHFLKTTAQGYGQPIRTVLMDLYDWPTDRAYERHLKKERTVIEAPISFSLLAAVATDLLFAYTDAESWSGGFMGRFLVLYGERDEFRMPATWNEAQAALVDLLGRFAHTGASPCGGFAPDAFKAFETWAAWRDSNTSEFDPRVRTFVAGSTTLAVKIALLYAADSYTAYGQAGWLVTYDHIERAVQFVEQLYLPSINHVGQKLAIGYWEKDRQRVLEIIAPTGEIGITERVLLRHLKMDIDYMNKLITSMIAEGTIQEHKATKHGKMYRCVPPDQRDSVVIPFAERSKDPVSALGYTPPDDFPNGG